MRTLLALGILWIPMLAPGRRAAADDCWPNGSAGPWKGYNQGVRWEKSQASAFERASSEKKLILLFQLVGDLDLEGCWAAGDLMRTVTFSDPEVAAYVNARFVPVWRNRGKDFHNCEKWTESRIFSAHDAYPTRNICTFLMTPDRKVVHYMAGYFAPDLFLALLKVADGLGAAGRRSEFVRIHRKMGDAMSLLSVQVRAALDRPGDWKGILDRYREYAYDDMTHKHSTDCLASLLETYDYMKEVHKQFASGGPVPFRSVMNDYLSGNPFSEEKGSRVDRATATESAPPRPGSAPSERKSGRSSQTDKE